MSSFVKTAPAGYTSSAGCEIPRCRELISSLLPPNPPFCERDFAFVLSEFYHRCALFTPWEEAHADTAENKNANQFKKLFNLICSAGAFVPYIVKEDDCFFITWKPYISLPDVSEIIKIPGFYQYAYENLNEWIRHKYIIFKNKLIKDCANCKFDERYRELLNLFFMGIKIDISRANGRSLYIEIKNWLSVLHIDFTKHQYEINIKDELEGFFISINLKIDGNKTPLFKCNNPDVFQTITALSNYLPEIIDLARQKTVFLSEKRLIFFIDSAASLLNRLGITVSLPKSLARELKPRLVVKADSSEKDEAGGSLANNSSLSNNSSLVRYLGLNELQEFKWEIAIGDEVLSIDEFNRLLNDNRKIVSFKNGFVKMEPQEFSYLLKRAKDAPPNKNDFLQAYFTGNFIPSNRIETNGGLAFDSRETIGNLFREHDFPVPASLNAVLRPYQKRGYSWICSLLYSGFGCILADDMGLGKTIQSIAVILRLKEEKLISGGVFIIAPAALIDNWEKELARFAPSLKICRYHGKNRSIKKGADIHLTTYQTVVRDLHKLNKEAFSMLLVDEAHLMKNPETRISRAVKQLRSKYRLALSGTPVENRLEDLRSLFDFILPGYLGDAARFKEHYRIPIEVKHNKETAKILRKITSPFLLRRVKTDKSIINDLPEKIICNEYAVLEKEQAALYQIVVDDSVNRSKSASSNIRASIILSLLTSLKQICGHPRVFDKESPAVSKLSGKAKLLITLLKEILANGEKTLIFSQYVETLECLRTIIRKDLKEDTLLYHGGLNQETRTDIVNRFQNDPASRILLISLKAGGLGLNLTCASRVIHYDLWYNPAVENQATDRAFRIGQKRNVFVHRFITRNSFEEKVDAMISAKRELADMTIASGESWIAKMSDEELKQLFERC